MDIHTIIIIAEDNDAIIIIAEDNDVIIMYK